MINIFIYHIEKNTGILLKIRGIGGTFFNDIILDNSFEKTLEYVKDAAYNYLNAYK